MCVVWKFQDEDSENSPLRKTAAHLSGRAARLSALPAARSCTPPLVPAAPCTRRALYPPRFVPALRPRFRTPPPPHPAVRSRCVPLAVVSRSPPAPVPRTRRTPPPSFDCRHPRSTPLLPPPRARRASVGPRCRDFSGRPHPDSETKAYLYPRIVRPRPANGSGPPTRPADPARRPDPAFGGRPSLCRCLRAEPSGGRSGLRRAPGRTPTSDP